MYFFHLIAITVIVVQFSSTIVAQSWQCTLEQFEYAPNSDGMFCVFRSVEWKKDSSFPSIPDRFFDKYPDLEILVVQNSTLEELTIRNRIKIVHAERNQITSFRIVGSGSKLIALHMQGNPLANIDPIVRSLKGLEVLDLSKTAVAENNDNTIDLSLFASFPNLTQLYLTSMQAHYVENEKQATLPKLKLLDLSGNPITPSNFRLQVFRTMPSLEELYLRDTIMSDLSVTDIREDFPALQRLYLDGNNLRCDLLELLLAHFKEKGIESPSQFRKCHLGYDSMEGLCCLSYIKNVPKNNTVPMPPKEDESTTMSITTDTVRTNDQASKESVSTNTILLYVGIGIVVLIGVVIIGFFMFKLKKKHQSVPTSDNIMHDDL